MGLKHLTDVHPRGNTQRVKHDIDRATLRIVRHIFNRFDRRDNTLVTMTSGHLVARLQMTLDRHINLNDLQYARGKIIALLKLALLVFIFLVKLLTPLDQLLLRPLDLLGQCFITNANLEPVRLGQGREEFSSDLLTFLQVSTTIRLNPNQRFLQTLEGSTLDDPEFVIKILTDRGQLLLFDLNRTLVFLDAVTGKDLDINNGTLGAGLDPQRGVFNVRGLFAEDRP